MKIHRLTF